MRIQINGTSREVAAGTTLAELAEQRPGVAAAVNGEVVPHWPVVIVQDGDVVEILSAFQGG